MLPLGPRLAIERLPLERTLSWGLVLTAEDRGISHAGIVANVGEGYRFGSRVLPLEIAVGDRVVYSTRIDSFILRTGAHLDIVEEASVIGKF
jgi:co-chaperonin GroES (HSP10)